MTTLSNKTFLYDDTAIHDGATTFGTFNPPGISMTQPMSIANCTISGTTSTGSLISMTPAGIKVDPKAEVTMHDFEGHTPKVSKILKAVKVVEGNMKAVAAYIVGKELDVAWHADGLTIGGVNPDNLELDDLVVNAGEWLVEDYDYANDLPYFRLATLKERKKYDLR